VIPTERTGAWPARIVAVDRHGVPAACFHRAAWKVRSALESRNERSVVVTSAVRSEGKTLTACNLALALASLGSGRVALVDLDLRDPSVGDSLGMTPKLGFEWCLVYDQPIGEVRVATDHPSLDVFATRAPVPNAPEVLAGPALRHRLAELKREYDVVVIDSPPVLSVPDTPLILVEAESCVCVVRSGQTNPSALRLALELLPSNKLLGTIVNSVRSVEHSDQYLYEPKTGSKGSKGR
jgi:Mrp family chromosome partitioning ATPase